MSGLGLAPAVWAQAASPWNRFVALAREHPTPAVAAIASLLAAAGMWLMLPRGNVRGRAAGGVLAAVALGLLASRVPLVADAATQAVFWVLGGITVVSAVGAVTFRSPVYCAIWFAMTLLGTAGLFLIQGAQFLAVATVVVYAGAILVTFLFVLMLAQPQGTTPADRVSWEPLWSACAGAAIVGVLTAVVASALAGAPAVPADPANPLLAGDHMARLGGELFSRHLISIEVAGTLLLVALVGAVAITAHERSQPPASRPASAPSSALPDEPAAAPPPAFDGRPRP